MKRQFKLVVPSFVAIIFCMLLIAGSTFALFTSQASAEISVTSGKVKISAEFKELEVYSATTEQTTYGQAGVIDSGSHAGTYYYAKQTRTYGNYHLFANNGDDTETGALMGERTLTLKNMTPGDKVTATLSLANESNVAIKYRVKVNLVSGLKLYEALKIKLDGVLLQGVSKTGTWTYLEAPNGTTDNMGDVAVEVLLPLTTGNDYQDLSTVLNFTIEAVQGNAATTNETLSTNIKVDKAVDTGAASQTLKDEEELVTVVVPTTALKDSTQSISLKVTPTTSQYAGTIVTSTTQAQAYDVKVLITSTTEESTAIKESNSENINVTMFVGTGLKGVKLYHNGQLIDSEYNEETGYITFTTQSFSEYTVVYNKDLVVENETTSGSEIVTYKATEEEGVYTDTNNNPVVVSEQGEIEAFEGLQITKGNDAKYQTRESFKAAFINKPSDYAGYTVTASSFDQFQDLALLCNEGVTFEGMTIKLTDNIDCTGKVWVPFGVYTEGAINNFKPGASENIVILNELRVFMGNIDGNGHKIINLSNTNSTETYTTSAYHSSISGTVGSNYGLIAVATGDIEIKNLDISFNIVENSSQALNCVGIIGHYYSQELTPISLHYQDANEQWHTEDNSRFDRENGRYTLKETTVAFRNVKTSGNISASDAVSVYIGTTYISSLSYIFDGTGTYAYRTDKGVLEGGNITSGDNTRWTNEQLQGFTTEGWFAESFRVGNSANKEITFYKGTGTNAVEKAFNSPSSATTSYAPLYVNYVFENCDNACDLSSSYRCGLFIGKLSHTINLTQYEIHFEDCTNSGDIITSKKYDCAAIICGFTVYEIIANYTNWENGLTNTGRVFYNATTEVTASENVDVLASYYYGGSYHRYAPVWYATGFQEEAIKMTRISDTEWACDIDLSNVDEASGKFFVNNVAADGKIAKDGKNQDWDLEGGNIYHVVLNAATAKATFTISDQE